MQQTRRSQPRRTKQKVAFFFASGVVSLKVMYKICTNFVPTLRLFLTRTGQVIKLGTNSATYLGIVLFLLLAFGEFFVLILVFALMSFGMFLRKGIV